MDAATNGQRIGVTLGDQGQRGDMGERVRHYREGYHIGAILFQEVDIFLLSHVAHEMEELALMSPPLQIGDERGDPNMEGPHNPVAGIDVNEGDSHMSPP